MNRRAFLVGLLSSTAAIGVTKLDLPRYVGSHLGVPIYEVHEFPIPNKFYKWIWDVQLEMIRQMHISMEMLGQSKPMTATEVKERCRG